MGNKTSERVDKQSGSSLLDGTREEHTLATSVLALLTPVAYKERPAQSESKKVNCRSKYTGISGRCSAV